MKNKTLKLFLSFILVFSIVMPQMALAASSPRIAVTKDVTGSVYLKKGGGKREFAAKSGMGLAQGDAIRTKAKSSTNVVYDDGSKSTVGPNSKVVISKLQNKNGSKQTKVKTYSGKVWNSVENLVNTNDEYEIETPTAIMGVRGTLFLVATDPNTGNTKVMVLDGEVGVSNNDETSDNSSSDEPDQTVSVNETVETASISEPVAEVEQLSALEFVKEVEVEILVEVIQDVIKAAEQAEKAALEKQQQFEQVADLAVIKESVKLAQQASALMQIQENVLNAIKAENKDKEIDSLLKARNQESLSAIEKQTVQLKEQVTKSEQTIVQQATEAGVTSAEIEDLAVESTPKAELTYVAPPSTGGGGGGTSTSDDNDDDDNEPTNPTTPPPGTVGDGNLSGYVKLQPGQIAPKGGVTATIRVIPQEQVDECLPPYEIEQEVVIPEGQNSVYYSMTNLPVGKYQIEYNLETNGHYSYDDNMDDFYINGLFYSTSGPVIQNNGAVVDINTSTSINLVAPKFNKIIGSISLPNGDIATADLYINVNGHAYDDGVSLNANKKVVIPAGLNSVQYELNAPVNFTNLYSIEFSVANQNNDSYVSRASYNNELEVVNIQNGDVENINMVLQKGYKIKGSIALPNEEIAPSGGYHVYISANDYSSSTHQSSGVGVTIPEGQNSVPYKIIVPPNGNYILNYDFYSSENQDYTRNGYYSETGTVFDDSSATEIPIDNSDFTQNVPIVIAKGQSLKVNMSLPVGQVAPSGGIPIYVAVNGNNYYGYNNDYITLGEGQNSVSHIFKGLPNGNYKLSYEIDSLINSCSKQGSAYEKYTTEGQYYWSDTNGVTASWNEANDINVSTTNEVSLSIVERPTLQFTPTDGGELSTSDSIKLSFSKPIMVEVEYGLIADLLEVDPIEISNGIYFIELDANGDEIGSPINGSLVTIVDEQTIEVTPPASLVSGKKYQIYLETYSYKFVDEKGFSVAGKLSSTFTNLGTNHEDFKVNFTPNATSMTTSPASIELTSVELSFTKPIKLTDGSSVDSTTVKPHIDFNWNGNPVDFNVEVIDEMTIRLNAVTSIMVYESDMVTIDISDSIVSTSDESLTGATSYTFNIWDF